MWTIPLRVHHETVFMVYGCLTLTPWFQIICLDLPTCRPLKGKAIWLHTKVLLRKNNRAGLIALTSPLEAMKWHHDNRKVHEACAYHEVIILLVVNFVQLYQCLWFLFMHMQTQRYLCDSPQPGHMLFYAVVGIITLRCSVILLSNVSIIHWLSVVFHVINFFFRPKQS